MFGRVCGVFSPLDFVLPLLFFFLRLEMDDTAASRSRHTFFPVFSTQVDTLVPRYVYIAPKHYKAMDNQPWRDFFTCYSVCMDVVASGRGHEEAPRCRLRICDASKIRQRRFPYQGKGSRKETCAKVEHTLFERTDRKLIYVGCRCREREKRWNYPSFSKINNTCS